MFMCEKHTSQDISCIKMFFVIVDQQVFYIDHSNHVICAVFVDWITGVFILAVQIDDFLIGIIHIHKTHVHFGNHDVLCGGVSKIKNIVDHVAFFWLDHAVLVADIHDCTDIFLSIAVRFCIGIHSHKKENTKGQLVHDEDQRGGDHHPCVDALCVGESNLFGIDRSTGLRCDLTKYQYDQCENTSGNAGCHSGKSGSGQPPGREDRCQGGSGNVHNVVSN